MYRTLPDQYPPPSTTITTMPSIQRHLPYRWTFSEQSMSTTTGIINNRTLCLVNLSDPPLSDRLATLISAPPFPSTTSSTIRQ